MIEAVMFVGGFVCGAAFSSLFFRYKVLKMLDVIESFVNVEELIKSVKNSLQMIKSTINDIWNGLDKLSGRTSDLKVEVERVGDKIDDLINTIESNYKIKIIAEKR